MSFASAWIGTTATTKSRSSPVSISITPWPLPSSRIGRVYGISKLAFGHSMASSTTWESGGRFPATPWPTPTRSGTGASMRTLRSRLIATARRLYSKEAFLDDLNETVYALDATTIDLCLSLFPWAHFRKDERSYQAPYPVGSAGQYPVLHPHLRWKTPRGQHSGYHSHRGRRFLYHGSGYLDYARLHRSFTGCSLLCNQGQVQPKMPTCLLSSSGSEHGPDLRSISPADCSKVRHGLSRQTASGEILRLRDQKNLGLSDEQLHFTGFDHCTLYRCRWQVELFFKWIKQNLRIKTFYGTSENAVKTQIWIAVSVYVLVAIMKKQLNIRASLYTILQVLSVSVFERTLLFQLLAQLDYKSQKTEIDNQLDLFN